MTTANYNIRIDEELKAQSFAVIERFGLSPAQAIRLFLKQTAETNKIPLSFDYESELKPSKGTLESIAQMQKGEYKTFDSLDELVEVYEKN